MDKTKTQGKKPLLIGGSPRMKQGGLLCAGISPYFLNQCLLSRPAEGQATWSPRPTRNLTTQLPGRQDPSPPLSLLGTSPPAACPSTRGGPFGA